MSAREKVGSSCRSKRGGGARWRAKMRAGPRDRWLGLGGALGHAQGVSSLFFFFSNSFSKEAFEKKTNKIKSETTAQKYYAQHECKNMFLPL